MAQRIVTNCNVTTWVRIRHVPHPFIDDLGLEFLQSDAGHGSVALQLTTRHLNSWNAVHGGVIMTLLDVAMAVAGRSLDPDAGG